MLLQKTQLTLLQLKQFNKQICTTKTNLKATYILNKVSREMQVPGQTTRATALKNSKDFHQQHINIVLYH